jgi:hypothetical protein
MAQYPSKAALWHPSAWIYVKKSGFEESSIFQGVPHISPRARARFKDGEEYPHKIIIIEILYIPSPTQGVGCSDVSIGPAETP